MRAVIPGCCSPRSCRSSRACSRSSRHNGSVERFYLTTPIYYPNAEPHIGHAYTTAIGDMIVRNHKQRGHETFFLTGVDEHATKVWRAAEAEGLTAQEFADRISVVWR